MSALITLTTDFGETAPYIAAMKGAILSVYRGARLIDLTHQIRPQDIRHADFFLGSAVRYFPAGTIHLAIVDPGVGGQRLPLLIAVGGQFLIGPDNGLFTSAIRTLGGSPIVRQLTEPQFWREQVSHTFHGRDLFGPVAAHLASGVDPEEFGPRLRGWIELPIHSAICWQDRCEGEVCFIDDFGNILTNIPQVQIKELPVRVALNGGLQEHVRWVRTYADAGPGELVCLFSSEGFFEIAVVQGHAAARLQATVGMSVELQFG
ncbi:MAG: SAM-dependent chlorinase/fluorinase [Bacteroidales bacterium]|nr:SAM-dependent chlorinase/fluorinase [Bacteroidales bacterium]